MRVGMTTKPEKIIKTFNLDAEISRKCEELAPLMGFKSFSALVEDRLGLWLQAEPVKAMYAKIHQEAA